MRPGTSQKGQAARELQARVQANGAIRDMPRAVRLWIKLKGLSFAIELYPGEFKENHFQLRVSPELSEAEEKQVRSIFPTLKYIRSN